MAEITLDQLYGFYIDTVERCTSKLRDQSDEEIAFELFEEFDIGAQTFLYCDNLEKLKRAGYINEEMVAISKEIGSRWISLKSKNWSIGEIREDEEWATLFHLCDRLLGIIRHQT